jgi:hypothetical protein
VAYQAWNTGDTVSAAAFTYLADAVINVFSTETARDAAITSPSDGMFAYTTTTPADTLSYYNGAAWVAVDLAGDITGLTAGTLVDITAATGPVPTINVDLSEAATSTSDADGDYFIVTDAASAQHKLTKANIALSGMNNDSGWTASAGTVTSVTGTAPIVSSGGATPAISVTTTDAQLVLNNLVFN